MPKRSDTKPWERLEGESAKAFEAFNIYLEMGAERSVRAVVHKCSKSVSLLLRWSSTYGWVERAKAYDADIQRRAHERAAKKRRQMADRHISIALKMQEKALEALEKMDPADIDPKNLVAMLREATKLERENRADVLDMTDPAKGEDGKESSLADIVASAWERRKADNEPDD